MRSKIREFWRSLYIEPELQFRLVLVLVILITLEGAFVGRGLLRLVFLAQDWRRLNLVGDFFWSLFWLLVPLVLLNIAIGLYWSLRFARPLHELERGLKDLRNGKLATMIEPVPGDALKNLVQSFNETAQRLNRLIHRDRGFVLEAVAELEKASTLKPDEIKKILPSVQSKLTIVNAHFSKEENHG